MLTKIRLKLATPLSIVIVILLHKLAIDHGTKYPAILPNAPPLASIDQLMGKSSS